VTEPLNARAVALVRERFGNRTPSNDEIAELLVEVASSVRGETMIRMAEWRDKADFAQEQLNKSREIERLRGGGWG
jgi:hypothetical protein